MRSKVLAAGLFSLLVITENCTAQIDAEDWIEQNAPDTPDEEPASLEYLQWLQDHPIDINSATVELLCRIPGIEGQDAGKIITFRTNNGPYRSTDDLSLVPDLASVVVRRMEGFVVASSPSPAKQSQIYADLRVRTFQDLQLRDGYRTGAYSGSADKSYARLTGAMEETIEAGILVEKDAGENPSAGFLSGYVSASNLSVIDQLIAGDFRLEAGEGLVFWQGGGFGGNLVESGSRNPRGLVPHRSTDEFHFLRGFGASASFSLKGIPFRTTGFISRRQLPGTTDESGLVTGLHEDGLFRTESELAKREAVGELVLGGSVIADPVKNLTLGVAVYASQFNKSVMLNNDTIPMQQRITLGGIHARWNTGVSELGGELAVDASGRSAWLVRGTQRAGRTGRIVALYRHYSSAFGGMHSAGFGARADTRNERGFYLGFLFRPGARISASLFVDHFAFPRPTPTVPVPSQGYDAGINVDAQLDPRTDLSLRSTRGKNQEVSAGSDAQGNAIWVLREVDQYRIRLTLVHEATKSIRLKTRFERTGFGQGIPGGKGTMLFQDMRVTTGFGLSAEARLVFFHTDSYDTRIYEFESDVPGAFSVPVLYGTGRRWYVLVKHELLSGVLLSLKFSETQKEGVRTLGSGSGEIEGDKESRLTAQIDVGF